MRCFFIGRKQRNAHARCSGGLAQGLVPGNALQSRRTIGHQQFNARGAGFLHDPGNLVNSAAWRNRNQERRIIAANLAQRHS
jgi:hypothetical protein